MYCCCPFPQLTMNKIQIKEEHSSVWWGPPFHTVLTIPNFSRGDLRDLPQYRVGKRPLYPGIEAALRLRLLWRYDGPHTPLTFRARPTSRSCGVCTLNSSRGASPINLSQEMLAAQGRCQNIPSRVCSLCIRLPPALSPPACSGSSGCRLLFRLWRVQEAP